MFGNKYRMLSTTGWSLFAIAFMFLVPFALMAGVESDGSQFTSFAGFELGNTTLGEISKLLGSSRLSESGDAGEYEAKICYQTSLGTVHFLSGELGGAEHDLLGFAISRNNQKKPCPAFPLSHAPKSLSLAGLYIGQSKAEFERVVATKVRWKRNTAYAFFESKKQITPSEIDRLPNEVKVATLSGESQNYFDVVVSIIGTFVDGELVKFEVWKTETL
jgi:hypothetical protein